MLNVRGLQSGYGQIQALHGIDFDIAEGEIVTIIGCNGAGKSTTLRTLSGLLKTRGGSIEFNNKAIHGLVATDIVKMGLIHVPEGRRIFSELTVSENLRIGAYLRNDADAIDADYDMTLEIFPRLKERLTQRGGSLSGGEQQMLAIARGLMARPQCLLLDEPSLGLAPILVEQVFTTIKDINSKGVTVLLVEQNANQALQIAHRGYVMRTGEIIKSDTGANLLKDDEVRALYLGGA